MFFVICKWLLTILFIQSLALADKIYISHCERAYTQEMYVNAYWSCKKAVEQENDPKSAAFLGMIYKNGIGTKKDLSKSLEMFKLAGKGGFIPAQYWVSVYYKNGENSAEMNPTKSFKWCKKAADNQYAEAEFNLGNYYYEGFGTEQDFSSAVIYWDRASKQGVADATTNLTNFCKAHSWVDACNRLK